MKKFVNIIIVILQILLLVVFFIGNKFDFSFKDFIVITILAFFFYLIVFFLLPKKILNHAHWYILGLSILALIILSIFHFSPGIVHAPDEIYVFGLSLSYFFCDFIRNKIQNKSNKSNEKTVEQTKVETEIKSQSKDEDSFTRKRFYAFFIDFFISLYIFALPYLFFILEPFSPEFQIPKSLQPVATILLFYISKLYLIFRDCPFKGSIGKRILKLDLLTEDGSKDVSVKKSILRNITMLILTVEIFYYLIYKKRIGDKLAHTKVEEKKKLY